MKLEDRRRDSKHPWAFESLVESCECEQLILRFHTISVGRILRYTERWSYYIL